MNLLLKGTVQFLSFGNLSGFQWAKFAVFCVQSIHLCCQIISHALRGWGKVVPKMVILGKISERIWESFVPYIFYYHINISTPKLPSIPHSTLYVYCHGQTSGMTSQSGSSNVLVLLSDHSMHDYMQQIYRPSSFGRYGIH